MQGFTNTRSSSKLNDLSCLSVMESTTSIQRTREHKHLLVTV